MTQSGSGRVLLTAALAVLSWAFTTAVTSAATIHVSEYRNRRI